MQQPAPPAKPTIATDLPALRLVALGPDDADAYYALVDRNRGHLTQHGDYTELGRATPASILEELRNPQSGSARFGIWLDDALIGRADLSPRVPGHHVIGYWLGGEYTGRGYATRACAALIRYGRDALGATAISAGVTKGNAASEALLGRLGFQAIEDRGAYTLFKLSLQQS
ncbi:MAG TPA: GNAT family N-acetyltransferase [Thermomicrobiales bacterium]|nr:GNAT family N-acetyltransferase [Thermomicrobiales bacterium]